MSETPTIASTSENLSTYFKNKTYDKVPIETFNADIYSMMTPVLPLIDTLRDKVASLFKPIRLSYTDVTINVIVDDQSNLLLMFSNGEAFVFSSSKPDFTFHLFCHSSDASTPGNAAIMLSINTVPEHNIFNPFYISKLTLMLDTIADIDSYITSLD